ncbi:MAG TPA: lytic transglycosylase, partial [Nitrobacter sp.]|nr:lytic transglycosylase [Nitrobacter sp.]
VPNSLDPVARGRTMPLPETRPSARIAKLFPPKTQKPVTPQPSASSLAPVDEPVGAAPASAAKAASSEATPLPAARPEVRSGRDRAQRHYHRRHYRHERHHNPR